MKKFFILFVSLTSIFMLLALIGAHFNENIFKLISFSRTNISDITIRPDLQFLLYLGLIGLVAFVGSRSYKK
jgi:NADH:ubiquinone oxidoreductase subunit 4 (subunit M)